MTRWVEGELKGGKRGKTVKETIIEGRVDRKDNMERWRGEGEVK